MPTALLSSEGALSHRSQRGAAGTALLLLAAGGLALVFAAIALVGAAMQWRHTYAVQHQWPAVQATIHDCRIQQRKASRNSVQFAYFAECAVQFDAAGEHVKGGFESRAAYNEHRIGSYGNPGIDELRAWIAQHPAGSAVAVHYDPAWPPSVELTEPPDIFDWYSNRLFVKTSEIAAMVGVTLVALGAIVGRLWPDRSRRAISSSR